MKLLILFITITMNLLAPSTKAVYIARAEGIRPYEAIWNAVIQVESSGNPLAIGDKHLTEWSYGVAQIRQVRLDDYNRRTKSNYTIKDAFCPEVPKRIFMYYCSQYNPNDVESISRCWNGGERGMSKKSTIDYWNKVKAKL